MTTRALAEDYVLGLLDGAVLAEAETLVETDPDFAAEVGRLRDRFLALDDTAETAVATEALWAGIATRIADAPGAAGTAAAGVPPAGPPAATPRTGGDRRAAVRRAGGRRTFVAALAATAASVALALALGWALFLRDAPVVVAVLLDDAGEVVALVETGRDNVSHVTLLEDVAVGRDRVLQVWTKPDPDGPPVSLGIIEEVTSRTLELAGFPPPSEDQLYEITIEQSGGSPTGGPTGPIVGKGLAQRPL